MAMTSQADEPEIVRITIRIYKSDHALLQECFANAGYNMALRKLIRKYCNTIRNRMTEKLGTSEEEFANIAKDIEHG